MAPRQRRSGSSLVPTFERNQPLGHSSITLTLDTYGHRSPGLAESLAERMDANFRSAASGG